MRVTYNSFYTALTDRMGNLNGIQQTALNQLSTGQKLTQPADDPTAMQRVLELRTSKAQLNQYWQNADDATSISKSSTNSLTQLHDVFTRVSELTTSGSSALTDSTSFHAYATETDQLLRQALTEANSKYSGKYLHGGTVTDTPPFVAYSDAAGLVPIPANDTTTPIALVKYVGNSTDAQVRIADSSTVCAYTSGAENLSIKDFLNNMVSLRDNLAAGDATAVKALVPVQGTIEDSLLSSISRAGGVQYRLKVSQTQDSQDFTANEALISRDADVDFADATVRLNRAQTAYSAAIQSGAKIAKNSLLDYI